MAEFFSLGIAIIKIGIQSKMDVDDQFESNRQKLELLLLKTEELKTRVLLDVLISALDALFDEQPVESKNIMAQFLRAFLHEVGQPQKMDGLRLEEYARHLIQHKSKHLNKWQVETGF